MKASEMVPKRANVFITFCVTAAVLILSAVSPNLHSDLQFTLSL